MTIQLRFIRSAALWLMLYAATCPGLAQRRMVPHLTSPTGGFTSKIVLANQTATTRTYRLSGFTQSGGAETSIEGELAPFQTMTRDAGELFGMNLSHFEIDRADDIAVSVVYQRDRQATGPAHVHENATQSRSWRIFPGNDAVTWDGLAAVNTGDAPHGYHGDPDR